MTDMRHNDIRIGDKFIIEIGAIDWSPQRGHRFWAKGFNTLCFDDNGIDKLKKYKEPPKKESPKDVPHSCEYCVYREISADSYPCSRCDKNADPKDMFAPKLIYG